MAFGARFLRDMAQEDRATATRSSARSIECGPAADGVLAAQWYDEGETEVFGATLEETRAFAMKALERRLKVIGLAPRLRLDGRGSALRAARLKRRAAGADAQDIRPPGDVGSAAAGSRRPSSSGTPSTSTSDMNGPDLARREVHDGDHQAALELLARVVA